MIPAILFDVYSIIPLLFTIYLAKRHVLQNRKNLYYIAAAVITIILLILEISSLLNVPSTETGLILTSRLINISGFSLSPVVPYIVFLFINNKTEFDLRRKLLALPLCINFLICAISYKTAWVFSVNLQNHYTRGPLFLLPTLVSMFYFALIIFNWFQNKEQYERADKGFLFSIGVLPVLATMVQFVFPDFLLIWGVVSMSLLLYYIYSLELQFSYDVQTGVKNRSAFEKEMRKNKKSVTVIFVFDVNYLKKINDKSGHKAGDDLIQCAANTIRNCFSDVGQTFRTGGDEFCVISREVLNQTKQAVNKLAEEHLLHLEDSLNKANLTSVNKIELAYGYAYYNPKEDESKYTSLLRADNAMYMHKEMLKGFSRRSYDR